MTLSNWSFSSQSRRGIFLLIAASFLALSILTILLDKCQNDEKLVRGINILIKAILKFYTTNQLCSLCIMGIVKQGLVNLFITLSCSHFLNKTDFEQYLFNTEQNCRHIII